AVSPRLEKGRSQGGRDRDGERSARQERRVDEHRPGDDYHAGWPEDLRHRRARPQRLTSSVVKMHGVLKVHGVGAPDSQILNSFEYCTEIVSRHAVAEEERNDRNLS